MTTSHTVRLDDRPYQKIKALSEKYNLTLSDVVDFLYDSKISETPEPPQEKK